MGAISKFSRLVAAAALAGAMATTVVGGAMAQSKDGNDRHVTIINETRHTLVRFYASKISSDDWEEDILGNSTLQPGGQVKINIDDGSGACLYDFKAVFDDGDELIRNRINVCTVGQYRYTEN